MRLARSLLSAWGSNIFMGGDVMRIEMNAAVALTVAILLNGCATVAREDDSLSIPPAPTTLSGDPCGTSQGDRDVECSATASDRPITLANFENANAELQRDEQPRTGPE